MATLLQDQEIKSLFKEAMVELFQERRDLFYDVIVEALEDIALLSAIQESESDELVERSEIFEILEGAA